MQKAPGKLYIAGEYAVTEPGYPAIIAAVDQFVSVTISQTEKVGRIRSSDQATSWKREKNHLLVSDQKHPFRFVLSAIEHTESYIQAIGKKLTVYQLTISSELAHRNGKKYGLGSSAAVTVATVRALLAFYGIKVDQSIVFKLAALSHLTIQENGSCGDVAACVYGGWIAYTSFDRMWLKQLLQSERDWLKLLHLNWLGLSVQQLVLPSALHLLVGWTGTPSSTPQLVSQVEQERKGREDAYLDFLKQSKTCVDQMIAGFLTQRPKDILSGVRENRRILSRFSSLFGLSIETEKLYELCTIAEKYGGAAKSSGAGGGDCGIVLVDRKTDASAIKEAWKKAGIVPLELHVCDKKYEMKGS
ncbi:phosphomevalonate kinase [Terrilactibacillus sp. BCM23-1]|uniref:phosphomevalonate kinase n=1 Tax=Terrilactibacillus tamarindi TaxID=2599694 RepID=A0A6N8CTQ8_9BACI|nr:phosphomevalonate kinase [Terrilactibacillus tamarindi]